MNKTIYLIAVKSITNRFLIKDGWYIGMPVKDDDNDYFEKLVRFIPGYEVYEDYEKAQKILDEGKNLFVGVEFEIVPFRMLNKSLQNIL